ncbi:MAG TPA: hypothetical protein VGF16_01935 [Bryobacteraceae bacterium]|jgi:hypothetical protein
MTPIEPLYAATLFLALASLLRWTHVRQSAARRLKRSLRVYMMSSPADVTLSAPRLKAA